MTGEEVPFQTINNTCMACGKPPDHPNHILGSSTYHTYQPTIIQNYPGHNDIPLAPPKYPPSPGIGMENIYSE